MFCHFPKTGALQPCDLRTSANGRRSLGIKAFKKGHSYVTLIYDLDNSVAEAISEGNDTKAAKDCFPRLSEQQIESVEAIAMDMSAAYFRAAEETLPLAEE